MNDIEHLALAMASIEQRVTDRKLALKHFEEFKQLVNSIPDVVEIHNLSSKARRAVKNNKSNADPAGAFSAEVVNEINSLNTLVKEAQKSGKKNAHELVTNAKDHYRETMDGIYKVYKGLISKIFARNKKAQEQLKILHKRGNELKRQLKRVHKKSNGGLYHAKRARAEKIRLAYRAYTSQLKKCIEEAQVDQKEVFDNLLKVDVPSLQAKIDNLDKETMMSLRKAVLVATANSLDRPANLIKQCSDAIGTIGAPMCIVSSIEAVTDERVNGNSARRHFPKRKTKEAAELAAPDWQNNQIKRNLLGEKYEAKLRDIGVIETSPNIPERPASTE